MRTINSEFEAALLWFLLADPGLAISWLR